MNTLFKSKYIISCIVIGILAFALTACSSSAIQSSAIARYNATASTNCKIGPTGPTITTGYPIGPLKGTRRWIIDQNGAVVILHGVNVVAKNKPYYPCAFNFNGQDAVWLNTNGLDIVRLGVLPSGEMPTKGHISQNYINHLISTVNTLASQHIYVLLDWHQDDYGRFFNDKGTSFRADGMPSWMTITNGKQNKQTNFPFDYINDPALQQAFQSFWDNSKIKNGLAIQQYYFEMLQAVAQRVVNNPWVLGYEILNEPWPGNTWQQCLVGKDACPSLDKTELDPFYAKAIAAIRKVDPSHLIFMEPFVLFNFGTPTSVAIPTGAKNVGLSFHQYTQSQIGVDNVFSNALKWAQTHNGPLLNTEFSSINDNATTIGMETSAGNNFLMSWTYWVFNNCNIACSPAAGTNVLLNSQNPPKGANIDTPVVNQLVQPYPLVTAGTPESLTYDAATHVLNYQWSSAKTASNGNFANGAATTILTPKLDFPSGYSVTAVGAKVISNACSTILILHQTQISTHITVTITPGSTCKN